MIQTDYDPSIPMIPADGEHLIQAMLNLVRNAMQSINSAKEPVEKGEILLRSRVIRNATIGEQFHRLAVKVDIADNGPGVPPHMLSTIFYPMISGRADGTGLGLPITHSILSQHKGLIECKSKAGKTIFSVVMPLAVAE
jgi:two-component system nitrogen regulation sensor histidine kinase GlnL